MTTPGGRWRLGAPLYVAETLMLEHAASGRTFDGFDDILPRGRRSAEAEASPRTIRAAVLRHLLTETDWPLDARGVQLRRVRISGLLDLTATSVRCPISLRDCDLDDPRPLSLNYATVPVLILQGCRLAGISGFNLVTAEKIAFDDSVISGTIALNGARIGGALELRGTQLGVGQDGISLLCNGMNVRLSVHLTRGFAAAGAVMMPRASIGGELICPGARLGVNESGYSLEAPGLRVGGTAYLHEKFTARGAVRLTGAHIGGQLRCDGARIGSDTAGSSLVCDGLRTGGSVHLDAADGEVFAADGAVRMAGAEITGSLSCRGARMGADRDGNALLADEMKASVAVLLDGGFSAAGAIRLSGADIGGQLRCRGGQITGTDRDGQSLVGDGIRVGGPANLDGGFTTAGAVELSGADVGGRLSLATARLGSGKGHRSLAGNGLRTGGDLLMDHGIFGGEIQLAGAVIGGSLSCRDADLGSGIEQNALVAVRLRAQGDVLLDRTNSAGTVIVAGADIGGRFCCRGARIHGDAAGDSLAADGVRVGGSVLLSERCSTTGAVQLSHATVGGSLHCSGASLGANGEGYALVAEQTNVTGGVLLDSSLAAAGTVSLRGVSIGRELRWDPLSPASAEVNLEGARAQQLTDNWTGERPLGHWPTRGLRLGGFVYDGFGSDYPATAAQRLGWIRAQYTAQPERAETAAPFSAQPYKQLADVYRKAGHEDDARAVEIAMRRDLRSYGSLSRPARSLNWVLDVTIRYGFQTGRALAGIVVLYLVVFLAFMFAQHQGNLIAATNVQNASLHPTALHCVTGYPCFYPAGYAFDLVVPLINIRQADFWQPNGHHWLGWAWILGSWMATALGWFLATLLVVGYSGLARQE